MNQPWIYMCSPSRFPLPPSSLPAPSWSSQCTRSESLSHDVFELWCWRRLLRVHWTARRSNQSILKESSLEYSLEGLMLKLKLQYFGHRMWRADSFEKTLMLGKIKGRRRRGWQRMRWLDGITDLMDMGLGGFLGDEQGGQVCCGSWGRKQLDMTERLNWTELIHNVYKLFFKLFSISSDGKASACIAGDPGLIPGLWRSPGKGNGSPLQYSCLENSMDRGAWWATTQGA